MAVAPDPSAPRASDTGQVLVFGATHGTSLPASPQTYRMIYGKRGFFGYTTAPDGETFWFAQLADTPEADWHQTVDHPVEARGGQGR